MMNDFAQAEACYREVLQIQRTERNLTAVAHTLVNLGNLHIASEHPEKARPYYLEAMDLLRESGDNRGLGILYTNLALQEARDGQWDQAVASFKQALDHHRMVGNEEGLAVTYSQLGKCFLDQGDLLSAERCLNNASEHYIKLGNEPAEAAVLRLLATVYQTRQDSTSALRCLERVVSLDERYALPELQADSGDLTRLRSNE
jgi:tetratricopeptide (TPR) repeat protein